MISFLSWTGTALQLLGAFFLAERWTSPRLAYAVMLPGAVIWLAIGVMTHQAALVVLMAAYSLINIRGLTRWKL